MTFELSEICGVAWFKMHWDRLSKAALQWQVFHRLVFISMQVMQVAFVFFSCSAVTFASFVGDVAYQIILFWSFNPCDNYHVDDCCTGLLLLADWISEVASQSKSGSESASKSHFMAILKSKYVPAAESHCRSRAQQYWMLALVIWRVKTSSLASAIESLIELQPRVLVTTCNSPRVVCNAVDFLRSSLNEALYILSALWQSIWLRVWYFN